MVKNLEIERRIGARLYRAFVTFSSNLTSGKPPRRVFWPLTHYHRGPLGWCAGVTVPTFTAWVSVNWGNRA